MSSHHKRKHWGGRNDKKKENRPQKTQEDTDVDESSPVIQMFRGFQEELDQKHDKHERIVKLSRDITIESKRAIFLLHRVTGTDDSKDVFDQTEEKLSALEHGKFKDIATELVGTDPHKFLRAYTAGLQEYIEALTFYQFLKEKKLVGLEAVRERLTFTFDVVENTQRSSSSTTDESVENTQELSLTDESKTKEEQNENDQKVESNATSSDEVTKQTVKVPIPFEEYILGVADLTGELMRRAINSVGAGNLDEPFNICNFLQEMEMAFACLGNTNREVGRKLHTLRQSIRKVEAACYTLKVRGSEIPKHMLADVLSKAGGQDFIDDSSCTVDDN